MDRIADVAMTLTQPKLLDRDGLDAFCVSFNLSSEIQTDTLGGTVTTRQKD
jgi:hypothetical protein